MGGIECILTNITRHMCATTHVTLVYLFIYLKKLFIFIRYILRLWALLSIKTYSICNCHDTKYHREKQKNRSVSRNETPISMNV